MSKSRFEEFCEALEGEYFFEDSTPEVLEEKKKGKKKLTKKEALALKKKKSIKEEKETSSGGNYFDIAGKKVSKKESEIQAIFNKTKNLVVAELKNMKITEPEETAIEFVSGLLSVPIIPGTSTVEKGTLSMGFPPSEQEIVSILHKKFGCPGSGGEFGIGL